LEWLQWLDQQAEQRHLNALEQFLNPLLKERFQQMCSQEDHKWKQRAKRNWIQMGDKNTKYFHQLASYQKRKNYMDAIINEGKTYHDHKQKAKVIHDHFCQLIGRAHEQQIHFNFANIMESQGISCKAFRTSSQ
jgi:hypothetical protein